MKSVWAICVIVATTAAVDTAARDGVGPPPSFFRHLLPSAARLSFGGGFDMIAEEEEEDRIVNGKATSIYNYPFLVSISDPREPNGGHFCGGALIGGETADYVLTAAHCIKGQTNFVVKMGATVLSDSNMKTSVVDSFTWRNDFGYDTSGTPRNDIALIKLKNRAPKSTSQPLKIKSIPLWNWKESDYSYKNYKAYFAGWGATNQNTRDQPSNQLLEGSTTLKSIAECKADFGKFGYSIGDDMMCGTVEAGGPDICNGDSGSPLVYTHWEGKWIWKGGKWEYIYTKSTDYVIGVAVGGHGCGQGHSSMLFTEVAYFYDWIMCVTWPSYSKCSTPRR